MASRWLRSLLLPLVLAGCAVGQDARITVPPHQPGAGPSALATTPRRVAVAPFREPGGPIGRLGERRTVGEISLGMVDVTPSPGRLVADAFGAELRAAGHAVGEGGEAMLSGEIRRFQLRTDVTLLYWDVVVEAEVAAALRRGTAAGESTYAARCAERTYVYPSAAIVQGLVVRCVADLAGQFRADRTMARVLQP